MSKRPPASWIAFRRPNPGARLKLFCFPYAGGGASMFISWIDKLCPEIDVLPVQLPGRETRLDEPPLTRLHDVADQAFEALRQHFHEPFAFFGYSLGAALAFEVAQRARTKLEVLPCHLVVAAHRAPQLQFRGETTYSLPDAEFRRRLLNLKGTRREVLENPELMELMAPLLRADFEAYETYDYTWQKQPLECPITAFGGSDDDEVRPEELQAWSALTSRSFERNMFEGDHFFIHRHATALAGAVKIALLQSA